MSESIVVQKESKIRKLTEILVLIFIAGLVVFSIWGFFKLKNLGSFKIVEDLDSLRVVNRELNLKNDTLLKQKQKALFVVDSILNENKKYKDSLITAKKHEKARIDSISLMYASQLDIELSKLFEKLDGQFTKKMAPNRR